MTRGAERDAVARSHDAVMAEELAKRALKELGLPDRGECAGRIAQECTREGSDRRPAARTHIGEQRMDCSTSRDGIHRSSQPPDRHVPSRFQEHENATGFGRNAKMRDLTPK